jgi:ribose 5-phosphate isomerase B
MKSSEKHNGPGVEALARRGEIIANVRTAGERPRLVGFAADHGGFELKQYLVETLRKGGCHVIDFGSRSLDPDDDYPDFVVPLARAVARGEVFRGVAICGSGVGVCVAANKLAGVRACLLHDTFSAHQGVEDDDLNVICLGGLVVGHALAWELVQTFLAARFTGEDRHRRRLAKVAEVENRVSAEPFWPGSVKVLGARLLSRVNRHL